MPAYLLDLCILTSAYYVGRSLRLAHRGDFVVPHARTPENKTFSIVGLLFEIAYLLIIFYLSSSFYKLLKKTFLSGRSSLTGVAS